MKDWLETIDDYLKMTRREIFSTAGRISHEQVLDKAYDEYKKIQGERSRQSFVGRKTLFREHRRAGQDGELKKMNGTDV